MRGQRHDVHRDGALEDRLADYSPAQLATVSRFVRDRHDFVTGSLATSPRTEPDDHDHRYASAVGAALMAGRAALLMWGYAG